MERIPLVFERPAEAEQLERGRALVERFGRRRSVRAFSADPVPWELIESAIRAAGSAPSGANQQPWRFVAVRDAELKRQIREAAETEERENYERRFPEEWKEALEPFGTDWHKEYLEMAPWLIAIFRIDYGLNQGRKVKHYYVQESVGIATGFLIAALHEMGLATLVHTPNPMGFLTRLLDRPVNERPFLLLPVGYPAEAVTVPAIEKKGLEEICILR
ncbi:MAG: nitroreductase family protein [Bryobacterales bacterium]|nr:nitroreductase family protein [Bryobacterales bacterium]MBL8235182.1 nitroreductase family protein [Bryobacterales bacterium]